ADGPEPLVDLASQRRLRVLLADDHPTNRKVIELMLAGLDVELVQVENGLEACVAVEAQPFDVILMDMQMPVLDGLSANRRIREHERQEARLRTPIIMLTANAMPDHVLESLASGADRHVCKPVQAAALFGAIQDLLAGDGVEKAA
ncbi:MAG TPA: response regulator, partial [Thermoanaerobaculia bacterium]